MILLLILGVVVFTVSQSNDKKVFQTPKIEKTSSLEVYFGMKNFTLEDEEIYSIGLKETTQAELDALIASWS